MKFRGLFWLAFALSFVILAYACSPGDYPVTIAVSGQGSTNPPPGSYVFKAGEPLRITAAPAEGWKFDGWSGDASGAEPSVTLKVSGKEGVTRRFPG